MSAVRRDEGKPRMDLIPPGPLLELAKVMTQPVIAGKYDEHNWRKGMAWSRVYAATLRHLNAFWSGEDLDPESGLPHPAHAAFGTFALLEYMNSHRQLDDRYGSKTRDHVLPVGAQASAERTHPVSNEAVQPVPGRPTGSLVLGGQSRLMDGMEIPEATKTSLDLGRTGIERATAALAAGAI